MSGLSKFSEEHEVLFARGSKLHVKGHSRDAEGRLVIEATLSHGEKSGGVAVEMKARDTEKRRALRFGWRAGDASVEPGDED